MAQIVKLTSPKKVFIENDPGELVGKMFKRKGWRVVDSILKADLVQFTGGEDIDPSLYGQHRHPTTSSNIKRDRKESLIYSVAVKASKSIAGICRGAQLLNILNGGQLWQHVGDGHKSDHMAYDIMNKKQIKVTSTHHQMMLPHNDERLYMLLLTCNLNCIKEKTTKTGTPIEVRGSRVDPEALIYWGTSSLCFQPHPEYLGNDELTDLYFYYLSFII